MTKEPTAESDLKDILAGSAAVTALLVEKLAERGWINREEFAQTLRSFADGLSVTRHPRGKFRYDASMLRTAATIIDANLAALPPPQRRWTPEVLDGGKEENQ